MNNKLNRILLNTDASEGVIITDPLDTNVNDIDTSFPLLPAGNYEMVLGDVTKVANKRGDGDNLVVPHKLVGEAQDIRGETVKGISVTVWVSLVKTPDYDDNSIKKGVARIAQAAGVSATVRQIIDNPGQLTGKSVGLVKVGVKKETPEYPASNKIIGYNK